ncbi:MAG TPA: hypothetical protein VML36_01875 [Nitrospiria bacterium]|nr:hypothetical protein [Nitrospiria bacterium]
MVVNAVMLRRLRPARSAVVVLSALFALMGCNNGANVTLQAMMDMSTTAQENSVSDGWTGVKLTPTGYAIGLQSVKLTSSTSSDSFTIFDQGTGAPLFTRLYNSPTRVTVASKNDISNGTYDHLELQVYYYEADISAVDAMQQTHIRRLRSYFQSMNEPLVCLCNNNNSTAVSPFDMLLSINDMTVPTSDNPNDLGDTTADLEWIDQTNGSPCTPRSTCTNNSNAPYQGSTGLFAGYPTVNNIPLNQTISVDSSTNSTFVINLIAGIQELFFYDETSDTSPSNTQFNYQYLTSTQPPPAPPPAQDGTIQLACSTPNCSVNPKTADFWIGPPTFITSVTSQ